MMQISNKMQKNNKKNNNKKILIKKELVNGINVSALSGPPFIIDDKKLAMGGFICIDGKLTHLPVGCCPVKY